MQPHGTWVLYFSRDAESAVSQSTLHIHWRSSVSVVATLVILLSATLLWMVSNSVHVWKLLFVISFQCGSVTLRARSVYGMAAVHCWQLEINLELLAFHMWYVTVLLVWKLEVDLPHGKHGTDVPSYLQSPMAPFIFRLLTSILTLAFIDFTDTLSSQYTLSHPRRPYSLQRNCVWCFWRLNSKHHVCENKLILCPCSFVCSTLLLLTMSNLICWPQRLQSAAGCGMGNYLIWPITSLSCDIHRYTCHNCW